MTPRFLENQLGRSLRNLGVECIDVYYLHNPESQLSEVSRPDFLERVRDAFIFLESAAAAGKIQFYGMATWNGFRQEARAARCHAARRTRHSSRTTLPATSIAFASCSFRSIWR